ncbi:hypothetical protein V6N11_057751 [Hibiscus sabdariffa]|uniref:Uncharacterized protein n=1 Tax=Hibiscus sabdariffa TaxID=183260 RepID=A0ABR2NIN9_9ROSI
MPTRFCIFTCCLDILLIFDAVPDRDTTTLAFLTVREFLSFAEGEVKSLTSLHSYVGKNADGLAHYFGEDPAKCPFEQDLSLSLLSATFSIVMSTLLSFSRTFLRAHEENCKQLELEMKKAKEAENEKLKK